MKEQKKAKNKTLFFQISAILILIAAFIWQFEPTRFIASCIMVAGVAGFAAVTFTTPYPGKSLRGKRLFNIQILAVLLMIVSAYLMFMQLMAWIVSLMVAAILTLYSAFILPRIYKEELEEAEANESGKRK